MEKLNHTADQSSIKNCNIKNLPESIEGRVELVLNTKLSPQKCRLVGYLSEHPDSWTMELAKECAVGWPPARFWELNREALPRFGLHALCYLPKVKMKNRHGDTSLEHKWRLILMSEKKRAA